jgi:hypothetical protein
MSFTTNACPSGAESTGWDASHLGHELREHPRIALEIPVAFRNADGQPCAAQLKNLSANGMQVCCNVATAQMIHLRGGRLQAENQPLLHATALLPIATGAETLSIGVRLL